MTQLLRYSFALLSLTALTNCGLPIAKLEAPLEVRAGDQISFNNASEDAVRYEWNFGDGKTSEATSPEHRFLSSGDYRVTLTAFNEKGKRKSTTENISVMPPSRCLIHIETPEGEMIAELFDQTPQHQDNFVKVAETTSISDLAIELGLPSGALQHTVAYYNRFAEIGEDPLFQKGAPYLRPVLGAPYRAWDLSVDKAFFPAHTFGGLHTTVDGQIVNSFGEAIPGLYAAGRTTAGLPTAPYIASGLSVGDCTYFGRRAGEAVATRPAGSA